MTKKLSQSSSISAALIWSESLLKISSDSAKTDSRLLMGFCLSKPLSYILTWPEKKLSRHEILCFEKYVQQRIAGEPIAYITGVKDFWTLSLKVNSDTLIPRPETELLVEHALTKLQQNPDARELLDLGTGSGAIALSLASELTHCHILATDFSEAALNVAEENAALNSIENISFLQSDWGVDIPLQKFDLIVSNPPYINENDPHLKRGDLRYEPECALWAKNEGFAAIESIVKYAVLHLNNNCWLLLEHGFTQGKKVRLMMVAEGFENVASEKDLSGHERITSGCFYRKVND